VGPQKPLFGEEHPKVDSSAMPVAFIGKLTAVLDQFKGE
jgi:hypothetical protein